METLITGFALPDAALFLVRLTMGTFFLTYRFRWVWDPTAKDKCWWSPTRRVRLIKRLYDCGYGCQPILAAMVALVEILAGAALIVGLLSVPAAASIFIIMVFANFCTPREEIPPMHPVDKMDIVRCYLHLAEPLYLILSSVVIFMGPGKWSLDYVIWSFFR